MKSTFCVLALLGAQLAVAQESGKTIVTEMLKHLKRQKLFRWPWPKPCQRRAIRSKRPRPK